MLNQPPTLSFNLRNITSLIFDDSESQSFTLCTVPSNINILFTKFSTEMNPSLMIRMGGDRTNNIQWINSTKLTNSQYLTEFGAAENSLQIK